MQVAELFAKLGLKVDRKSWSVGNDVIAGLGKALVAFVGYKVIGGLGDMVMHTIEAGDQAVKAAQKLGITAEAVQELSYAAGQSGTSFDAVSAALGKFAHGLQEVRKTGKGPVAEALQKLGVHMKDLNGETLDQNLELLAERFSKMPDGAKKASLAMDLFGKAGKDLIPFLNSGQAGIVALRNEANELGVVIGGDAAKGMEEVGDDIDRVKSALIGLRTQAVVALMPVIKEMVSGLLRWVKANRQMLAQKVEGLIRGLASVLRFLASAIAFAVEHWHSFAAILAGTAVVTSIIRLVKLIQWMQAATTIAAVKTLAAWALAALPFIALAAGIAIIVLLFTKYRKQTLAAIIAIKDKFRAFGAWVKGLFVAAGSAISDFGAAVAKKFKEVWEDIKKGARELWDYIRNLPGKAWDALTGTGDSGMIQQINADMKRRALESNTAPARSMGTMPGGNSSSVSMGDINVQSPSSDPVEVGKEVRKVVREEWDSRMRESLAGTGAP